jgi:hypothetical protein
MVDAADRADLSEYLLSGRILSCRYAGTKSPHETRHHTRDHWDCIRHTWCNSKLEFISQLVSNFTRAHYTPLRVAGGQAGREQEKLKTHGIRLIKKMNGLQFIILQSVHFNNFIRSLIQTG